MSSRCWTASSPPSTRTAARSSCAVHLASARPRCSTRWRPRRRRAGCACCARRASRPSRPSRTPDCAGCSGRSCDRRSTRQRSRWRRCARPSITPRQDAPPDLFAVAMAALTVLTTAADELPVVVLVDDLHWLDAPSTEALGFVLRRIQDDAIVAVTATRHDGPGDREAREMVLQPLVPAAARTLLERTAHALPPPNQRQILRLADGNPLAIIELALADAHGSHAPLRSDDAIPLTARLIDAFAQRAVGLDDAARAVLLAAALAPGTTRDEIVRAAAVAADTAPSYDALDDTIDAGLLTDDDAAVAFRHPLARAAVITTSTRSERRTMHRSLATVISEPERNVWHRAQAAVAARREPRGRARGPRPSPLRPADRRPPGARRRADRRHRRAGPPAHRRRGTGHRPRRPPPRPPPGGDGRSARTERRRPPAPARPAHRVRRRRPPRRAAVPRADRPVT